MMTYDSASQRVAVRLTDRTYGDRRLAIVADLDEHDQPTGTGYIVAITADTEPIVDGHEIGFRSPIVDDSARGEWLANWGGPSDQYDDAESWITHHADIGDSRDIVELFAELMRRKWGDSAGTAATVARAIVRAVPCAHECGQDRITRIDDAVRWLAACCDDIDAYVCDDGRVRLTGVAS